MCEPDSRDGSSEYQYFSAICTNSSSSLTRVIFAPEFVAPATYGKMHLLQAQYQNGQIRITKSCDVVPCYQWLLQRAGGSQLGPITYLLVLGYDSGYS